MSQRLAALLTGLSLLVLAAPARAQQAPAGGTGGWAPGPAAQGDSTALVGVIDTPAPNASVSPGSLRLAGWFVDKTAQGWAGADAVEVFLGSFETGRPLTHTTFAQSRPDVGAAIGNPFFSQSGWSASVSTSSLAAGPSTLSVYVHAPNKGWWFKQVSVTVRPAPSPTPRPPAPTPAPAAPPLGYDISYPQCPTGAEPAQPAFGIVGVNGGLAFTGNPCLARQYVWALTSTSPTQPHVGLYMNTGNPGPTASSHWPPASTTTPRPCDGSWSPECSYDYGWLAAQDAYARGVAVAGRSAAAKLPWWLDVEAANSWSTDSASNAADLEGVIAYLRSVGVTTIGIYSTTTDWETIVGAASPDASINGPFAALLNWRPGPRSLQEAPSWCSRSVTGGRVSLVQFPLGGFDANLVCG